VSHRYEWLYVYGFVKPQTGETFWYLIPRVNTKWLNLVYESFALDVGISEKKVLLVEDNAGWHRSKNAKIPDGISVEFLPAYSPELQPAERLWTLVDEPLVNEYFETIEELEEVLVLRCNVLREMKAEIKNLTHYHWLKFP
jgi:transposase